MKVPVKLGWEAKLLTIKTRVYPLRNKARQLVDKIFDKIHYLSLLKFIKVQIPFSFPVFVAQKTDIKGKKESRIVVNIQKLTKIVFSDSYLLFL